MAEIKDAFVCYRSYIEAIRLLPEDKRWGFFDGILCYALDDIEPKFDGTESIMFTLIGSEWIFQIYEDYKYITIRGILFQFISLILMFVLVRNSSDLFAYVWITVISCSGANIQCCF